jgi:hypothetical protein
MSSLHNGRFANPTIELSEVGALEHLGANGFRNANCSRLENCKHSACSAFRSTLGFAFGFAFGSSSFLQDLRNCSHRFLRFGAQCSDESLTHYFGLYMSDFGIIPQECHERFHSAGLFHQLLQ